LPSGFAQLADPLDFLAGFAQTHTQGTADAIGAAQASGLRLIRDRVRSALLAVRRILPADTAAPALILGALMVADGALHLDHLARIKQLSTNASPSSLMYVEFLMNSCCRSSRSRAARDSVGRVADAVERALLRREDAQVSG
jgi:hypothetical protein